jgi:hypothetical protein
VEQEREANPTPPASPANGVGYALAGLNAFLQLADRNAGMTDRSGLFASQTKERIDDITSLIEASRCPARPSSRRATPLGGV